MARLFAALAALMLLGGAPAAAAPPAAPQPPRYAVVTPDAPLRFPSDHGAHPDYRTEWWYLTGWLKTPQGPLGFQVTFFRSRPPVDQANPSAVAARPVLVALAALSDPRVGRLLHEQRIARAGFGMAEASTRDTDIVLDDWRLKRSADGRFHTQVGGQDFALDLTFTPAQPVLAQGQGGYSRKGPRPAQASHYFSLPHLAVTGSVRRGGRTVAATGDAWLDREWSSTLLDPKAVGWDWTGLNLDDGGAVMAFQMRDAAGKPLWAGGSVRSPDGAVTRLAPSQVRFATRRNWRSPRTGAVYPVERDLTLDLPRGARRWRLVPLFDDQELDSRGAGGPVYWEGAVTTAGGRGYLELTGYVQPLSF